MCPAKRDDDTLSELADDWITDCQHRGLSDKTIKVYRFSVGSYITSQGEDLANFDRASARRWLAQMKHLKPATRQTRLSALKSFGSYLVDEKLVEVSPIAGLRGPKVTVEPVEPYTAEDVQAMIKVCGVSGFTSRRNAAIIILLASTGMRLHEAASIKLSMIDMQHKIIFIIGKGGKHRQVPISARLLKALSRYMTHRNKHKFADSDWLWLGERNPYLSEHGIDKVIRSTAERAGVKAARAHKFRNTAAIQMLEDGMSESSVMNIFGWSNVKMLQRYSAAKATDIAHGEYRKLYG